MAQAPERARLEYHRSHLLYYRKHNGALARGALRALLAARGARGPRCAASWPATPGGAGSAQRSSLSPAAAEPDRARLGLGPKRSSCYCHRWICRPEGPLKIAIDVRKWRDYGIGTYVRNLVRHLARLDHETTYFLFCNDADEPTLRDLAENFVPVVDGSAALRRCASTSRSRSSCAGWAPSCSTRRTTCGRCCARARRW